MSPKFASKIAAISSSVKSGRMAGSTGLIT